MTPEDVLLEAISVTSQKGDSVRLREDQCKKLKMSIEYYAFAYTSKQHEQVN